jgi:hypothetical protein
MLGNRRIRPKLKSNPALLESTTLAQKLTLNFRIARVARDEKDEGVDALPLPILFVLDELFNGTSELRIGKRLKAFALSDRQS